LVIRKNENNFTWINDHHVISFHLLDDIFYSNITPYNITSSNNDRYHERDIYPCFFPSMLEFSEHSNQINALTMIVVMIKFHSIDDEMPHNSVELSAVR
jgi:hypothetical protein